jgi:hypothetical protein
MYGREWKRVAADIKTRTSAQIRSHAQKYFAKLAKVCFVCVCVCVGCWGVRVLGGVSVCVGVLVCVYVVCVGGWGGGGGDCGEGEGETRP